MDEEDISPRIIGIAVLAVLLFISQAFIFTSIFSIGSIVFSAVFCYFIFFTARNSLLHEKDLKNNLKIKDRMNLKIDFWN